MYAVYNTVHFVEKSAIYAVSADNILKCQYPFDNILAAWIERMLITTQILMICVKQLQSILVINPSWD